MGRGTFFVSDVTSGYLARKIKKSAGVWLELVVVVLCWRCGVIERCGVIISSSGVASRVTAQRCRPYSLF